MLFLYRLEIKPGGKCSHYIYIYIISYLPEKNLFQIKKVAHPCEYIFYKIL